jgi:hypothetical protein
MSEDEQRIAQAIEYMKAARTLLKKASCPKTLERLRLTLTSAQGAMRNAGYTRVRATYEPRKRIKRAPRARIVRAQ